MAHLGNKNYVVECKKTDYSWVFAKSKGKGNVLHMMWNVEDRALVVSTRDTEDFQSASSHLSLVFKDNGRLAQDGNLARTSYKDADDAVKQVLKNTRAYLIDCHDKGVVLKQRYVIPLIVTNNPILLLQYDESKIDENADLQEEPLVEEVEGIIYNYPEAFGFENSSDEWKTYGDGVMKSVFITSLKNLHKFLDVINIQSLSYGSSGRPPAKTFGMNN